jgi:hypothetical protein
VGLDLSRGIFITGYLLFNWYSTVPKEEKEEIRKEYSKLLKTDLSTTCFKTLNYADIEEALKHAVSNTIEGKITLVPS